MHEGTIEKQVEDEYFNVAVGISATGEVDKASGTFEPSLVETVKRYVTPYRRPSIYAFRPFPALFPDWVKVGFTQRPSERIEEWKKHYPDLAAFTEFWDAAVGKDCYFTDHAVHAWLKARGFAHIEKSQMPVIDGVHAYYSSEIYAGPTQADIDEAVAYINADYSKDLGEFSYYSVEDGQKIGEEITLKGPYTMRPDDQQIAHDRFFSAIEKGRRKLLMFAPPRFGKTFTSLMIAKDLRIKSVLVVSAKADVESEWADTVLGIRNFADDKWAFVTSKDLAADQGLLKRLKKEGKVVVIFCTLQDLQGRTFKRKHWQLIEFHIDLLIVDETHFGARSAEFGAKLRDGDCDESEYLKAGMEDIEEAEVDIQLADQVLGVFHPTYWLHLSGTPYRIMMTNEFSSEDVIYAARYPETIRLRDKWYEENKWVHEWENPFFGVPSILTLAYNIVVNANADFAEKLSKRSIFNISELHAVWEKTGKFKYPEEVEEFWKLLDGTALGSGVLALFNDKDLFEGRIGTHIVVVLPSRAACQALENMFAEKKDEFKNFSKYHVLNITPLDSSRYPSTVEVKKKIKAWDEAGEFSLTLTVNRMLTGSTVPQWNTMLYIKSGSSAQDYDQAKCRLLSPYIRKMVSEDGSYFIENMKPQVVFIDFEPGRVFEMEAQLAFAEMESCGIADSGAVIKRIGSNLATSPVLAVEAIKVGGIKEVSSTDVMKYIAKYNEMKDPAERILDADLDLGLFNDEELGESLLEFSGMGIGGSNKISMAANVAEDDAVEVDLDLGVEEESDSEDDESDLQDVGDDAGKNVSSGNAAAAADDIQKKREALRNYMMRVNMGAWIVDKQVESFAELMELLSDEDVARKFKMLGLDRETLEKFHEKANGMFLFKLDQIVQSTSTLVHDDDVDVIDKLRYFYKTFKRISDSEVITSLDVAKMMVDMFEDEHLLQCAGNGTRLLDFSSEAGEYSVALYLKLQALGCSQDEIRRGICAVAASPAAYVMTCRTYEMLGLNVDNICANFDVFDLYDMIVSAGGDYTSISRKLCQPGKKMAQIGLDDVVGEDSEMVKFGAVVGNPPYQQETGGAGRQSKPIYPHFVNLSEAIASHVCLIIPSRWFAGGMGLDEFRNKMMCDKHMVSIVDYVNAKECFPDLSIGGVCYFYWNEEQETEKCKITNILNGKANTSERSLDEFPVVIRYNQAVSILHKVQEKKESTVDGLISPMSPFGLSTKVRGTQEKTNKTDLRVLSSKGFGYIPKSDVQGKNPKLMSSHKVAISRCSAEHAGEPDKNGQFRVLTRSMQVLCPNDVCTHSYVLMGPASTEDEAQNMMRYLKTPFARFFVLLALSSININQLAFKLVPVQDFGSDSDISWTDDIDDLNKQLCDKYGLSEEDRKFIKSLIKDF